VEGSPVYYGWVVLLAATFGMMMTAPGQTFGVSVFLDSIIAELDLRRSTVSLLYTVGTLIGSLALPLWGRFIDSRGPRTGVVVIAAAFAVACVVMGFVSDVLSLLVGFVLIRGLGQGALGLVSLHVINIWFVRRRGLAIGLSGLGIALTTGFFPLFSQYLLDSFGWRLSYMLLGALVAAAMLPVGALFFRSHPETYGLKPDSGGQGGTMGPEEIAYTLTQARRTLTFWLFVSGDFLVAALGTGLIFHHYSIMASGGLDRIAASAFFIPLGALSAGAILVTGVLMDRIPPRFLLSLGLLFLAAAILLAGVVDSPGLALLYGSLLGLANGIKGAVGGSVYAHYFGRRHLGAIKGAAITITVAGTAVGPLLYGLGYEVAGNYLPVLLASTVAPLAVALVAPFMRPRRGDGSLA
jgi:MFS family permease